MKQDWTWDDEAKVVHNILSKDLDELDNAYVDYDFSVYGYVVGDDIILPVGMTDTIPTAAVDLTQNHLDRVVMGLDGDSISTLGTATVS